MTIDAIIGANCFAKPDRRVSPVIGIDECMNCCGSVSESPGSCSSPSCNVRKLSHQLKNYAQIFTSSTDNTLIPAMPPCLFLAALMDCIMDLGAPDCCVLVRCVEES